MNTKTQDYLTERIERDGAVCMVLFDPPKQKPEKAGQIAKIAEEEGADVILIGGSAGAQGELLDQTILEIKKQCKLPVVLFPGGVGTISRHADAIYFMSMINSRNPYWISQAQITASPHIKHLKLEPIPTTYIVVEPGETVGWVGEANAIPRHKNDLGGYCALTGEYFGSKLVIFESGSGSPTHAPEEMIAYASKLVTIPIIVAGGVKNAEQAASLIRAGASGVHIGTVVEDANGDSEKARAKVKEIVQAIKSAGREKLNK